jgi:hypothetical protein
MATQTESLLTALKAIAGMKVDAATDHAQLSALCIAIAKIELQKFCCGDAACFNESNGVKCNAMEARAA